MSSGYTLGYALNVALEDESTSDRATISSIPIIVEEILRQSKEPEIPTVDARATTETLAKALDILLDRLDFSGDYDLKLTTLSRDLKDSVLKSPSLVAGILAWDRLSEENKRTTLARIAVMGSKIIDNLIGGDRMNVNVAIGYIGRESHPFAKPNGLVDSYLHASDARHVDGDWTITLNTHEDVTVMTEPYGPIQEVFSGLVKLFHYRLANLETLRVNRYLLPDHDNLKQIFTQNAAVPPELPRFYEKQLHVAAATARGGVFASELERLIDEKGHKIVHSGNFLSKLDTLITYGSLTL